ncbi:MAG TPA: dephospho-CoA kinase [Ornithinibacter sp.]|nr:dephospho-CoA kinase [Ornithinibacter sp.]
MLRVGLTGGIGSGKSTVSAQLASLGAVVVDADAVAREVVEPGTPALAAIADRFGPEVLTADGRLDRPGLGRIAFGDPAALRDLEAITHPAIWTRTASLVAAAPPDAVVVHDMPLIVEKGMAAQYHLVVVVGAGEQVRLRRLVDQRGMPEADARARIAAQATDEERRVAADVWLHNEASTVALRASVLRLWHERIEPFELNLRHGIRSRLSHPTISAPDPTWPAQAARLLARIGRAVGDAALSLDHIGSTAVPGLVAKDVIDLQVGVASLDEADTPEFVAAMAAAGFVRAEGSWHDNGKDGSSWPKRFHGSCDPGRVAHVHVREMGSPGWAWALMFRDWLRDDAAERVSYASMKTALAGQAGSIDDYVDGKEPWFDAADGRARSWATRTGWVPEAGRRAR